MSFFDSFVGGAAEAGAGIIGNHMKQQEELERQKQLAKLQEELFVQRTNTVKELDRAFNAKAGQEILDGAAKIKAERLMPQIDKLNDPEIGQMTPEEKQQLANATPAQQREVGIKSESRAQDLDDQATVAMRNGYFDHEKNIRGQQQIELSRQAEDRKTTALENTAKQQARLADIKEQLAEQKAQHGEDWLKVMMARLEKSGNNTDHTNAEMIKSIDSDRKEIAQKVKQTQDAIANTSNKDVIADLNTKLTGYLGEYEALNARKQTLYKRLGFDAPEITPAKSKALTFDPKTGTFK